MQAQTKTVTFRNAIRSAILAAPLTLAITSVPITALAESGTFRVGDVNIHYADEGEGEAVVFLHGFAGSSDMWSAVGLMPIHGFRTLAADARGHGRSTKPEDASSYGAELVGDVIRLMDERDIEQAHVVGFSMGAETALNLVTAYPERVLSVVAAGSGWSGEAEAQSYAFIASALGQTDTFGGFMADMAPPDQELPPEAAEAMMELLGAHGIDPAQSAAPLSAVAASLHEIISIEAAALAGIDVPVLAIAGSDDPERANVEALAEVIPDVTVTIIPDADHLMTPVSPEFTAAIIAFLNQ